MVFGCDDLVIRKDENGKYTAGGFNINSCILQSGGKEGPNPACVIFNNKQNGGGAGTLINGLKDLAVPAGLLYLQQSISKNYQINNKDEVISDGLYDKLFNLASLSDTNETTQKKKQMTRKKIKNIKSDKNKNTRKQRK